MRVLLCGGIDEELTRRERGAAAEIDGCPKRTNNRAAAPRRRKLADDSRRLSVRGVCEISPPLQYLRGQKGMVSEPQSRAWHFFAATFAPLPRSTSPLAAVRRALLRWRFVCGTSPLSLSPRFRAALPCVRLARRAICTLFSVQHFPACAFVACRFRSAPAKKFIFPPPAAFGGAVKARPALPPICRAGRKARICVLFC